ncbi:MAG: hypothetical protein JO337_07215 [Acidimicrobiales bacterium]|nr:hypothetical protein [Acidimicrobiales bacterium]
MEQRGVPSVLVHTAAFRTLAHSSLKYRQFDYVPLFELPRFLDNMSDDDVRRLADGVALDIVHQLLDP